MVVEKICGASAERGDPLGTVAAYGRQVAEGARGMAVADQGAAKAAEAAEQGAESTVDITAARGRASYIGEAARGVTDPGALVMDWFFAELRG